MIKKMILNFLRNKLLKITNISKSLLIYSFVITLLSGCLRSEDINNENELEENIPTPTQSETVVTPIEGGVLKLSMRIPKTLNPLLNEDVTVDRILKLIFEPLVVLDEKQKPIPNIAETIEFAPDGLSVLITLKNNITWSDGEPITSNDLIFSLQTIEASSEQSIYKKNIDNISNYSKVDEKTVKISYYKPQGGSAYMLCFPLIPKHYYNKDFKPDSNTNMTPLGNGLYKFDNYKNVREVNLSINEKTFRERPYITNINVVITSNIETDLYAFNESILDVVNTDVTNWGKYRGTKVANIDEYTSSYYDFIGFNFSKSLFQEKKIREAIAHSIDVDELVQNIYLNHAVRAYSPINPSSWLFEPNTVKYDFNLDMAAELLAESGCKDSNENGILDKDFAGVTHELSFKVIVNEENDERVKICNILNENLKKVGIHTEIYVLPFDEYEKALVSGDFDIFVGGFNMSVVPDLTFAFHSAYVSNIIGKNYFLYKSTVMDSLLNQANNSVSEESYKRDLAEVQKYIAEDLPCVSLVFRKSAVLTGIRIKGTKKPVINNIFSNVNQWFIMEREF